MVLRDAVSDLFFLHIPKTAGTSFKVACETLGIPAYHCLLCEVPPGFRVLTFLREPLARCLSHYNHAWTHWTPEHEHYDWLHRTRPGPVEFFEAGLDGIDYNLQSHFLGWSLSGLWWVGIVERYEASLVDLEYRLGVSLPRARENVSRKRVERFSDGERRHFLRRCQRDLELYREAHRRWG